MADCCALYLIHSICYYIVACILYAYNFSLATCLFSVDYTCSMDGEGVNATSGSPVLGGALWCGYLCNVLGIYGDVEVGSADCESIKCFDIIVFLCLHHVCTYLLYLPCRLSFIL